MRPLAAMTPAQLKAVERTLSGGTWIITAGAVLFSVLTVTPLVQRVTPDSWDWTAPILPIVVDAAVVIVIRMDATVSRLGERGGPWPAILRWLTGAMTLALNIGDSALKGDLVGVAVHSVAPLLLITTAEAALAYRRAIARAQDRIAREQREDEERKRRERAAREQRDRDERERREQSERDERERERAVREQSEREAREHELRREREQRDAEREQREWSAAQERDREERERLDRLEREQAEREERERREDIERQERERRDQAEREKRERAGQELKARLEYEERERERVRLERQARREQSAPAVREHPRPAVREQSARPAAGVRPQPSGPAANTAKDKLEEPEARAAITAGLAEEAGVRELARRTGWSVAWVSERMKEAREQAAANTAAAASVADDLVGSGAQN